MVKKGTSKVVFAKSNRFKEQKELDERNYYVNVDAVMKKSTGVVIPK